MIITFFSVFDIIMISMTAILISARFVGQFRELGETLTKLIQNRQSPILWGMWAYSRSTLLIIEHEVRSKWLWWTCVEVVTDYNDLCRSVPRMPLRTLHITIQDQTCCMNTGDMRCLIIYSSHHFNMSYDERFKSMDIHMKDEGNSNILIEQM